MKTHALALLLATAATPAAASPDYGAFLSSELAASQGDLDLAANQILTALGADPNSPTLQRDAFVISLLAGRHEAVILAPKVRDNPIAELALADASAKSGDWQAAELAFAELPHDQLLDVLKPLLLAWSQQAQGHTDRALETITAASQDSHYGTFYTLHAALIADLAHRDGLANRLYTQLTGAMATPSLRFSTMLASWQARSGDMAAAKSTIMALVSATPELNMALPQLMADIARPRIASPLEGMAEAYSGVATALKDENQGEVSALLLQLAAMLAPQMSEPHLVAAELYSSRGDARLAAEAEEKVSPSDPIYPVIQVHLAGDYAHLGKLKEAEDMLHALAERFPDRPEPVAELGDVLLNAKQYRDAIAAYSEAIALVPNPGKNDWTLFFDRGAAYQALHELNKSEADMKIALKLNPEQPSVLNFLGFSWADENRNLPEARRMIQRALDLRPNDGAIVDSLGWVVLRQGDVHQAVKLLEKAAELEPVDPTITGHLGDAYWEAGRRLEAEDQWRRALVLKPEPDDAARIEARLKSAGK
jgi:tetratricopeptide (TPR) repeat protein